MKGYSPEYILYRHVSYYLRAQYPNVIFHFDSTGLHLTKTQSGQLKAIQGCKGYPDLAILHPVKSEKNGTYHGLFIELKAEGTKIYKLNGEPVNPHIAEQLEYLLQLKKKGYAVAFGIGFDNTKRVIDNYMTGRL